MKNRLNLSLTTLLVFLIFSYPSSGNISNVSGRLNKIEQRVRGIENRADVFINRPQSNSLNIREKVKRVEERINEIRKDIKNRKKQKIASDNSLQFELEFTIAFPGLNPGRLLAPKGIDFNEEGIFVADCDNHRIQHFEFSGKYNKCFNTFSEELQERLEQPVDLICGFAGSIFVLDKKLCKVIEFQSNGKYINEFGNFGDDAGEFCDPSGIAVDSKGAIYIADAGNNRIQKFDSDGKYLDCVGEFGSGEYQFNFPRDVAIDDKDSIYVLDQGNDCIKIYRNSLDFQKKINLGRNVFPVSIYIDGQERIYVTQKKQGVLIYSPEGKLVGKVRNGMKSPYGIVYRQKLFVTDSEKHQILVYSEKR